MKQAIQALLRALPTVSISISASRRSVQREAAQQKISWEVGMLLLETTEDTVVPELAKI